MEWTSRLVTACWLVFLVYWAASARNTRKAKRNLPAVQYILMTLLTSIGAAAIFASIGRATLGLRVIPDSQALQVGCVAATALGLAIAIAARRSLGANWSGRVIVQEGHELVRTGPYRYVRHPIYSGLLLMLLATALLQGTIAALIGYVLITVMFVWKLRLEELFMRDAFGEAYVQYQREVKALIPGLL